MIRLLKDNLGGIIRKVFVVLRPKMYSYLTDDGTRKDVKGTRKNIIKCTIKFEGYKDCLENNETILNSQQKFRSETKIVSTEKVNKIALRANYGERL